MQVSEFIILIESNNLICFSSLLSTPKRQLLNIYCVVLEILPGAVKLIVFSLQDCVQIKTLVNSWLPWIV